MSYVETRELGQGGPILGPILLHWAHLVAPLLKGTDFILAFINLATAGIDATSAAREKLILLESVENNKACYFTDLENTVRREHPLLIG